MSCLQGTATLTEELMTPDNDLLDRVRKLLAKAEDESCTTHEAEALTAKASELMARYGIERAQLGALHPETDKPASRKFPVLNPWGSVKLNLLNGIARALRCQCVQTADSGTVLHVFGYASDIERAEMLWTSLLVQQQRALARYQVSARARGNAAKADRRSFLLGFNFAVVARVQAAEERAAEQAEAADRPEGGTSTALVLADRSLVVNAQVNAEYPRLRSSRVTYSGSGYGEGRAAGQKADIGGAKVGSGGQRSLSR
jgi:hypothetical protein